MCWAPLFPTACSLSGAYQQVALFVFGRTGSLPLAVLTAGLSQLISLPLDVAVLSPMAADRWICSLLHPRVSARSCGALAVLVPFLPCYVTAGMADFRLRGNRA